MPSKSRKTVVPENLESVTEEKASFSVVEEKKMVPSGGTRKRGGRKTGASKKMNIVAESEKGVQSSISPELDESESGQSTTRSMKTMATRRGKKIANPVLESKKGSKTGTLLGQHESEVVSSTGKSKRTTAPRRGKRIMNDHLVNDIDKVLDKPTIPEQDGSEAGVIPSENTTASKRGRKRKTDEANSKAISELEPQVNNSTDGSEIALKELSIVLNKEDASCDQEETKTNAEKRKTVAGAKGKGKKRAKQNDQEDEQSEKAAKIPKKTDKKSSESNKPSEIKDMDFSSDSKSAKGDAWNYKISSWNINGLRAWLEKGGMTYLNSENPDILCVQETKCSDDKLPANVKNVEGYHTYWLSGDKDGYSGVGLLSKEKPLDVKYGIGSDEHDKEGRVITAEYEKFFLIAAYVPNAGRGLVRLDYRMKWDQDFCKYLTKLDQEKPIILCGDLNVAHQEIDLANPKTNKKNAGFTKEEREGFSTLLEQGFIDSFRHFYPDVKGAYSFWTYMMNARAKNVGWRLDYFVVSKRLDEKLCDSVIRKDVMGSDHCPITLLLSL